MAKKFKPTTSKINESVDISVEGKVRAKIIAYAQKRLNQSGAELLAPVDEIITFDDPMDGMISFYYLDNIAEDEEASEDASGYQYIEDAVSDIAEFIQELGFTMDEDSEDVIIFISDDYDDEELDDMNEATKISKLVDPKKYGVDTDEVYPDGTTPLLIDNRDLGFVAIAYRDNPNKEEYSLKLITDKKEICESEKSNWKEKDIKQAFKLLGKAKKMRDFGAVRFRYNLRSKTDLTFNNYKLSKNGDILSYYKDTTYYISPSMEDYYNFLPDGRVVSNLISDYHVPANVKLESNTDTLDKIVQSLDKSDNNSKANVYDVDKVPYVTYNIDGIPRVACLGAYYDSRDIKEASIVIANGKSIRDIYSSNNRVVVTDDTINQRMIQDQLDLLSELANSTTASEEVYALRSVLSQNTIKELEGLNKSTSINESASIIHSDHYREHNLLPKGRGSWMGPIELENEDVGIWAIAGTLFDEDDPDNENEYDNVVIIFPLDTRYDEYSVIAILDDYSPAAKDIMKRLAKIKTPDELAKIIKGNEFQGYYGIKNKTDFIDLIKKLDSKMNESTMMINESAKIKPCNPELEGFDLLDSNNPFDFEPVDLENEELGFYAIAGVATGMGGDFDEDDCSIEICITALDPDATDEVLVAEYYDMDYKAMMVMEKLAKADVFPELANILHTEGFEGMNGDYNDFIEELTYLSDMNEATEVPDGRMTVELDDTDVIEGDTLLLAELTDDVFNAVNTVLDELDPDADVEVTVDNEDLLQLAVVSDEDLDDDAFDQVLSELLEDMDLEDIVADMTDSEPIEDPDDEDFGRVIQYINFYPSTGATVVPEDSVMDDNIDVIEDEESINESASTKTDFIKLLDKLADEFKKEFKSNPDVEGTSFSFIKKGKDKVVIHAIADSVNPGSRALSNYLNFLDDNGVEYKTLQKFEYYKGALNCTIYTTIKITDIKDADDVVPTFESTAPDYSSLANKVKDCIATYYSDGVVQRASVEVNKNKDSVICVDLKFPNRDGINAKEAKEVSKLVLSKFDNLRTLENKKEAVPQFNTRIDIKGDCLVYYVLYYNNARPGEKMLARYNFVVTNSSMNESTDVSDDSRIWKYVDDFNFKSGVKFLDGDDNINKVLKAISPKLDISSYHLDKLPWTTYTIDGKDKVAVLGISGRLYSPMAIAITDGKNISDFVSNSKSILVFTNKKLEDWNNVTIVARIMNNLAKVIDRASEYKSIKSLLDKYEKQAYNYEQFDESVDPIYESYYKDTDEDLSIDQAKITKALKAISRILTKEGYPLDNLDEVYRFNYPRPGLIETSLIPTLKSTYGILGNAAYAIDDKIEKKLQSLDITYCSRRNKSGKDIYKSIDKLVNYDSNDIAKYIKTGKVPDREYRSDRISNVHPQLEEIAKGITEYITSHPTYKKYNTYGYKPVHVGAAYISIKVEVANVEYGKEILSDTDKYIKKNYKDLYPIIRSNPPDKKYPYIDYSLLDTGRPLGHLMWSEYKMRGSSIKKLMNESVDDDNSESIASYDYSESAKSPKLPTQSELKTIIQKSMIKFGERNTQVTVHAYRTSKYDGGVVEVDLDGTSLATDGREEDYYDEDNIKNALEYAAKELVDKFGQDKDLLDYIDVQYNKVGSLTITFSLDSELNESYSMNEATKVTFRYEEEKDWVSPEDFKKIEKFATKMEDALERYLRRLRDLGPDDKLKDQVYTEINVENREKIIIETKTKNKVLKKDIGRLYAKGNGPDPSINLSQLPLEDVKATHRGIGWYISPIDKSLVVYVYTGFKSLAEPNYFTRIMRGEIKPGDPDPNAKATNESTKFDFDNLEEVLEEDLDSAIDLPDYADNIIVYSYPTGQGYGIKVTFDERLVNDNKLRIIDKIVKTVASRCGKDYDLDHSRNKSKGEYSLTFSFKSKLNESTDYKKVADKLETSVNKDADLKDGDVVISVDRDDYGYDIIAEFDNRLLGSNPNKTIDKVVNSLVKRNGKYSDLAHYNNKATGKYRIILSYKGNINESAVLSYDDNQVNITRKEELSRELNTEQPLVDPYDIRCTIRPVFVRKDQFLFDGSTVYKATSNASTDKDSGTTEIKVDVLLSEDPDVTDSSTTLTLPTEFDGLKLLRCNPIKVYNESTNVKDDTVTLRFSTEEDAKEFIKDNELKPEDSYNGKFGWVVVLKKSDLKKIK